MRVLSSLLILVLATPCLGVPVVGTFEMRVASGASSVGVQAGDVIRGSFGYDTDSPVISEDAFSGSSYAGDFFRVSVGEQTWEMRDDVTVRLRDFQTSSERYQPGEPQPDPFEIFAVSAQDPTPVSFPGLEAGGQPGMFLRIFDGSDLDLDLLANEQLPRGLDEFNLEEGDGGPMIVQNGSTWRFDASQTSLSSFNLQVVPEPTVFSTAWVLWIVGFHHFAHRRRVSQ